MRRWLKFLLFGLLSLLLLAGLSSWLLTAYAVPAAQNWLSAQAAARGYVNLGFTFTGLAPTQIRVTQQEREITRAELALWPLWRNWRAGKKLSLAELWLACPEAAKQETERNLQDYVALKLPALPNLPEFEIGQLHLHCAGTQAQLALAHAQGIVTATGTLTGAGAQVQLSSAQLDLASSAITLQGQLQLGELRADITASREFADEQPRLRMTAEVAGLNLLDKPLTAHLTLEQEKLTATLRGEQTELTFTGNMDLARARLDGQLRGQLQAGPVQAVGITTNKLGYDLRTQRLAPVRVSITALQLGGLPLTAVAATLAAEKNQVSLRAARGLLFGGQVLLAPVTLALPLQRAQLMITLQELDVAQLIQLGAVDGLAGEGRVSGQIPLTYAKGKVTLGKAELQAAAPGGQIRYQPAQLPSFMAAGGQGALLGQIFDDFAYDTLTLGLGGTLGDNLSLTVRLAGRNAKFYNGHPVVFNLNLSGALESLLTKGLQNFSFTPQVLGELVREGEKK